MIAISLDIPEGVDWSLSKQGETYTVTICIVLNPEQRAEGRKAPSNPYRAMGLGTTAEYANAAAIDKWKSDGSPTYN